MNRKITALTAFALAAGMAAAASAQSAGKVATSDFSFATPPAPAPALKLYTSAQYPSTARFNGGVRVAVGDVNGDGMADLVALEGTGAQAHVKVFDGKTGAALSSVSPASIGAGVGDANGDGKADIIINTGGVAGGIIINRGAGNGGIIINKPGSETAATHVKAFDGATGQAILIGLLVPAVQKVRDAAPAKR